MGHLIPAGTGMQKYEELNVISEADVSDALEPELSEEDFTL
jgi:hypothetical protein